MTKDKEILQKLLKTLLNKGLPFAAYRLPGEENVNVVVQKTKRKLNFDVNEICKREGFVAAPFESVVSETGNFIKADYFASKYDDYKKIVNAVSEFTNEEKPKFNGDNYEMTKQEYLDTAEFLINQIKQGKVEKVVLSRVIKEPVDKNIDLSSIFLNLAGKYKSAFVYLFTFPGENIWIGATPETLIKENANNEFEIVSLAGTMTADENKEKGWSEKEKREQKYVTGYIESKLSGLGIKDFVEEPVKTVKAGHLVHLNTTFRIPEKSVGGKLGELVKRLHPTPAVCGLAKVDAYNLIHRAEIHERRYYTGYLGPWGLDNKKQLFVNLRCAEINGDNMCFYVGGGLTEDSVPEKEWEETLQKAKTLLSVMEQ